jgi:ATP-dependent Clp protease ATP-binding subunit ClpB
MIRVDGSEYSEKHSISRLIGSPPGYVGHSEGGQLTEYVRRKPYSIVLIDEVEKACREFVTLFLQVLDDGRLTDGQGRVVDFRNTVIIMTSNLGAAFLNDMGEGAVKPHTRQLVMGAIQSHFPPEFINRIDEIVVFVSCTYFTFWFFLAATDRARFDSARFRTKTYSRSSTFD